MRSTHWKILRKVSRPVVAESLPDGRVTNTITGRLNPKRLASKDKDHVIRMQASAALAGERLHICKRPTGRRATERPLSAGSTSDPANQCMKTRSKPDVEIKEAAPTSREREGSRPTGEVVLLVEDNSINMQVTFAQLSWLSVR